MPQVLDSTPKRQGGRGGGSGQSKANSLLICKKGEFLKRSRPGQWQSPVRRESSQAKSQKLFEPAGSQPGSLPLKPPKGLYSISRNSVLKTLNCCNGARKQNMFTAMNYLQVLMEEGRNYIEHLLAFKISGGPAHTLPNISSLPYELETWAFESGGRAHTQAPLPTSRSTHHLGPVGQLNSVVIQDDEFYALVWAALQGGTQIHRNKVTLLLRCEPQTLERIPGDQPGCWFILGCHRPEG